MTDLTVQELHILRHSLGIWDDGRYRGNGHPIYKGGDTYRNHYCSDPSPVLCSLTERGLLERGRKQLDSTPDVWHVTGAGIAAVVAHAPVPGNKRKAKAQGRWARWCQAQEAYPDLTFPEFLQVDNNKVGADL